MFKQFLKDYAVRHFFKDDESMDLTSINVSLDPLVEEYGLIFGQDRYQELDHGIVVYPTEYFCAFDIKNWHPVITDNSFTVHYMVIGYTTIVYDMFHIGH